MIPRGIVNVGKEEFSATEIQTLQNLPAMENSPGKEMCSKVFPEQLPEAGWQPWDPGNSQNESITSELFHTSGSSLLHQLAGKGGGSCCSSAINVLLQL